MWHCHRVRSGEGKWGGTEGYVMAGLLVAIGAMAIIATVLSPYWQVAIKREKEAELVFRGEQYIRAIELYQRQFPGAYPTSLEALVEQKFLRRAYLDPITREPFEILTEATTGISPRQGEAQLQIPTSRAPNGEANELPSSAATINFLPNGIIGVVSRSSDSSMRLYNERARYNDWLFVYLPEASQLPAGLEAQPSNTFNGVPNTSQPTSRFGGLNPIPNTPTR